MKFYICNLSGPSEGLKICGEIEQSKRKALLTSVVAIDYQLTAFLAINMLSTYLMPPMAILLGALDSRDFDWIAASYR